MCNAMRYCTWIMLFTKKLTVFLNCPKEKYRDPEVYITENGWSDGDVQPPILEDTGRICYYMTYIDEVLKGTYGKGFIAAVPYDTDIYHHK